MAKLCHGFGERCVRVCVRTRAVCGRVQVATMIVWGILVVCPCAICSSGRSGARGGNGTQMMATRRLSPRSTCTLQHLECGM
eukprot:2944587-Prymnesium_polylepis.1